MADDPDLESAYALETPEDNLRLYKSWAETYDRDFVTAAAYRLPELVARAYVAAGGGFPCLDVGCGTGAVAAAMPDSTLIDGLDLSPEMLEVARGKGLYRHLIQANLKERLPLEDGQIPGLLSAGTFTHGHVGAEALDELTRILAPGGLAVLSIRDEIWETMGFDQTFTRLIADRRITAPERRAERVYATAEAAPEGHADDLAFITTFRRL